MSALRFIASTLDWPRAYRETGEHPDNEENDLGDDLQGGATDGRHWFITQGPYAEPSKLWRIPISVDLRVDNVFREPGVSRIAIPEELSGYRHFGDCDHHRGLVYVAVEANDTGRDAPVVAIFEAATLSYLGNFPLSHQGARRAGHAPWCAVNPVTGILWSSVDDGAESVRGYRLTGGYVGELPLLDKDGAPLTLYGVQGGAFSRLGHLYMTTDGSDRGAGRVTARSDSAEYAQGIFAFDSLTGKLVHHIEYPYDDEVEGIAIWPLQEGQAPGIAASQVHLFVIDPDVDRDEFSVEHYAVDPSDVGKI